ncbi:MAG: nucleoside triphosphate diphosphatase, partial [Pseudonocardiales bacterium]|nr:nucleoside triphosphate diphosphatase [Pseudonocardiales bacterium]
VALSQPAAARAAMLVSRAGKAGLPAALAGAAHGGDGPGERLFALVAEVKLAGAVPEQVLRAAAGRFAADVRTAEQSARVAGLDSHQLGADDWNRFWPHGQS